MLLIFMNGERALLVGVASTPETNDLVTVAETSTTAASFVCSATSCSSYYVAICGAIVALCLFYYVVVIDNDFTFNFEVVAQS